MDLPVEDGRLATVALLCPACRFIALYAPVPDSPWWECWTCGRQVGGVPACRRAEVDMPDPRVLSLDA